VFLVSDTSANQKHFFQACIVYIGKQLTNGWSEYPKQRSQYYIQSKSENPKGLRVLTIRALNTIVHEVYAWRKVIYL
jgi:hypothetical protein